MTRARYTQVSLDSTPYYHCSVVLFGRLASPAAAGEARRHPKNRCAAGG